MMHAQNPRTATEISSSDSRPPAGLATSRSGRIFRPGQNSSCKPGGEGFQKLKNRLVSSDIPQSVVDELLEQSMIVNYIRSSFVFMQGAPTDLVFWISSGLVDIISPGADGEQITSSVLGPGDIFGFVGLADDKGSTGQAFQARARTNAQIGLLNRNHVARVLVRQDPLLLVGILERVIAAWNESTLHYNRFLGENHNRRLETVFAHLAAKFGIKESRGILLIPEFTHSDLAEMIGCSRPMVSRLIAEMIAAGRLAQHGKQYIMLEGGRK